MLVTSLKSVELYGADDGNIIRWNLETLKGEFRTSVK